MNLETQVVEAEVLMTLHVQANYGGSLAGDQRVLVQLAAIPPQLSGSAWPSVGASCVCLSPPGPGK